MSTIPEVFKNFYETQSIMIRFTSWSLENIGTVIQSFTVKSETLIPHR